jgi:hypothetical protein
MKLTQPKERLAASGMAWTEDFSPGAVKAIGSLEVLAAIGLILPAVLNIVPVMVPVAAPVAGDVDPRPVRQLPHHVTACTPASVRFLVCEL